MKGQIKTWLTAPFRLPWWGSVVVATVVYYGLKYGIPQLQLANPILRQLSQAAPSVAPILAILWLLLAAKQLYDTDEKPENKKSSDEKHQEPPTE